MSEEQFDVRLTVNGTPRPVRVPARRLLSDALRHDLGLTGTHVGCEHGVCGACTVLLDGRPVRSCLVLAVSADGHEVTTVEGLTNADGSLGPVQQAFLECHGLQCGFCTPGFLTTITAGLRDNPTPSHDEAREMVAGNLCRCTGYQNIVKSVERASVLLRAQRAKDANELEEVEQRSEERATVVEQRAQRASSRPVVETTAADAGTEPIDDRTDDTASTGLGA